MEQIELAAKAFAAAEVQRVLELVAADYALDPHELAFRYCPTRRAHAAAAATGSRRDRNSTTKMARRKIAGTQDDIRIRFREIHVDGATLLLDETTRQVFSCPEADPSRRHPVGVLLADGTLLRGTVSAQHSTT